MRIISGQIDNFGKLSNYTFEFQEGLNIINEENGWGKTTFAAFLKAMFFGMEYSRSKKVLIDRVRYMPWNGGKFGGSLQFSIKEKEYRIVRSFGKKESEDTFLLYDLQTNLETQDYSANIGEEIWKIDRDSFDKTAFITLKEFDLLNDIISGKLGDIEEQEADMEASTMAISSLERSINRLGSKRSTSTGSIKNLKENQANLKLQLDECLQALEDQEVLEVKLLALTKERESITLSLDAIDEEYKHMQHLNQKKMYNDLLQSVEEARNNYEQIKSNFPNGVPSKEKIQELERYMNDYYKSLDNRKELEFSQETLQEYETLAHKFGGQIQGEEQLDSYINMLTQISVVESKMQHIGISPEEMSRLEELDKMYHPIVDKEVNVDQLINDYIGVSELDKRAALYSIELENIQEDNTEEERKKAQKKDMCMIVINIVISFLGVFLFFNLSSVIIGFFITILGICATVFNIFKYAGRGGHPSAYEQFGETTKEELQLKLDATLKTREELKAGYTEILTLLEFYTDDIMNTLLSAKSEIQEYKRLIVSKEIASQNNKELLEELVSKQELVDGFLGRFIEVSGNLNRKEALETVINWAKRFEQLQQQFTKFQGAVALSTDWEKVIQSQLGEYFTGLELDYKEALDSIKRNIIMLQERGKEFTRVNEKYDKFVEENNMKHIMALDNNTIMSVQYLEQISENKNRLTKQKEELAGTIFSIRKETETLARQGDMAMDLEVAIDTISHEIKVLEEEANIKMLTKECMVLAKENLAQKYMGSITESFDKYRKLIEDEELSNYHIDLALNVKVEQDGILYPVDNLSKGKYDLLQICMRLALVEAVFKDQEIPTLILDDPFVNLDDQRLRNAITLFEKLAKQHQLVYFVCHSSRLVNN